MDFVGQLNQIARTESSELDIILRQVSSEQYSNGLPDDPDLLCISKYETTTTESGWSISLTQRYHDLLRLIKGEQTVPGDGDSVEACLARFYEKSGLKVKPISIDYNIYTLTLNNTRYDTPFLSITFDSRGDINLPEYTNRESHPEFLDLCPLKFEDYLEAFKTMCRIMSYKANQLSETKQQPLLWYEMAPETSVTVAMGVIAGSDQHKSN